MFANGRISFCIIASFQIYLACGEQGCGSTFNATDEAQNLTFTHSDTSPRQCDWRVDAREGRRVKVTLSYTCQGTVCEGEHPGCDVAKTFAIDLDGDRDPDIGKWCGQSENTYTSWSRSMRVTILISTPNVTLHVQLQDVAYTPCHYKEEVTDTLPHTFSYEIPENMDAIDSFCRWELDVTQQYTRNRTLHLQIVVEEIPGALGCIKLYEKQKSESHNLGEMCKEGRYTFQYYMKHALLEFVSSFAAFRFKVEYQMKDQESSCHTELTARETEQELTTEKHPNPYKSFQRCSFLIRVPQGDKNVKLEVQWSELSIDCDHEYALVYDGDSERGEMIGEWCGVIRNRRDWKIYRSMRGSMFIVIVMSNNWFYGRNGISAVYKEELYGEDLAADYNMRLLMFPAGYGRFTRQLHAVWTITAEDLDRKVFVSISQSSITCPESKMTFDISDVDRVTYCKPLEQAFLSRRNKMTVILVSQGGMAIHFQLKYRSMSHHGCDGAMKYLTANQMSEQLESPGYPMMYPNNVNCVWRISSDVSWSKVKAQVYSMQLDDKCDDYLAFYNGYVSDLTRTPDLKLCKRMNDIYKSKGSKMTVYFSSDTVLSQGQGFLLTYEVANEQIEEEEPITDGQSGSQVNLGAILAPIIVIIVLILIVAIACVIIRRRKQRSSNLPAIHTAHAHTRETHSPFLAPTSYDPPAYVPPHPSDHTVTPSAPPLQQFDKDLPPPSYDEALSKGMITSETPM